MFKALANADRRYAGAVSALYGKDPGMMGAFGQMTAGAPLGSGYDTLVADSILEKTAGYGTLAALDLTNASARYGIPAGVITLAGKELLDLTNAFESQTNSTLMP